MKKSQLMLKIQNSIEVFENPIFGQIRMSMVDDEPMFCLVDVCRAYGSILLDGKVKESTILDTMGHTDISCTKDHYYFDRTGIEEKRQELDLIEAL